MPELQTFLKFNDPGFATAVGEQLGAAGIAYFVERVASHYDPALIGGIPESAVHLRIPPADFAHAHAILEDHYEKQLTEIDPDYYLLTFTDNELFDILAKPDEWGYFDYVLAKRLLIDRGHPITEQHLASLKVQRLADLVEEETPAMSSVQPAMPIRRFAFYTRVFDIPVGFMNILISHTFATRKKTLPDGSEGHAFSSKTRKRGRILTIMLIIFFTLLFIYAIMLRN